MRRALLALTLLCVSVLGEPPVPQGQYGAPGGSFGGYSAGGYTGNAGGSAFGNGQYDSRDEPMVTHEQDFQQSPGVIWGKYTVALPDGRIQKVEYDADENGFHPIVTYDDPEDNGIGGAGGFSNGGYSNGGQGGFSSGGQGGYSSGGQGGYSNGGSRSGGFSRGGSSGDRGGYNY